MTLSDGIRKLLGKDTEADGNIDLRHRRSILLRRVFPPDRPAEAVGHFGGLPRLPSDIEWPRDAGTNLPMMFVASIDLSKLPVADPAIGMPENGTLLFFVSADGGTWNDAGDPRIGHVLFLPEGTAATAERTPPADAPPCFGDEWMYHFKRIANVEDAPRSFDRWLIEARAKDSFCTIVLDPDRHVPDIDAWIEQATRKNLEATYSAYGCKATERGYYPDALDPLPPSPYPQVWRMIEAVAGAIRFSTKPVRRGRWDRPSEGKLARDRAHAQAHEEAKAWGIKAATHDPFEKPTEADHRRFRDWITDLDSRKYRPPGDYSPSRFAETIRLVSNSTIHEARQETLDELVALDPARLRAVMPEAESLIEWRHSVVIDQMGEEKIVEHQMLGWGSEVQDIVSRRRDDILLLQLDSDHGIRWMLGDCGVIQFWITAHDLAERRFDRVVTTFAGH